jgi:hypothetical protein
MFRNNTNKLFILIVCVIPSIVLLWDAWGAVNLLELILEIATRIFGIAIFIFLPCFLTVTIAENFQKKLEPGKKWLVALLYFPVSFMMFVAVYSLLEMKFNPELGSSTSGLIMIIPLIYGVPAAGVIYFMMYIILNRKKKFPS